MINAIDNVDLCGWRLLLDEKSALQNTSYSFPGGVRTRSFTNNRQLKTEAYAVYADVTFHATDKLTVGVGGRYSHDKKAQGLRSNNANPLASFVAPNTSLSSSKFTPRATIRYEVADRTNVYATVSRGFRAASFNAAASSISAAILPIKPETITSYEVGFKTAQRIRSAPRSRPSTMTTRT